MSGVPRATHPASRAHFILDLFHPFWLFISLPRWGIIWGPSSLLGPHFLILVFLSLSFLLPRDMASPSCVSVLWFVNCGAVWERPRVHHATIGDSGSFLTLVPWLRMSRSVIGAFRTDSLPTHFLNGKPDWQPCSSKSGPPTQIFHLNVNCNRKIRNKTQKQFGYTSFTEGSIVVRPLRVRWLNKKATNSLSTSNASKYSHACCLLRVCIETA